ncbi:MAG: hypothetical protein WB473_13380, partial [Pedococcus sp.]
MTARPARPLRALGVGALALLVATACDTGAPVAQQSTTPGSTSSSTPPASSTSTSQSPTTSSTTTKPTAPPRSCGQRLAAQLTPAERAGQLLMVGLQPSGSSTRLAAQVRSQHLGGVIYLGGWSGGTVSMARISARLQKGADGSLL